MSFKAKNKVNYLDIVAVTFLILMSGTIYFYILYGNIFIPLYFIFGIFYYLHKTKTVTNKTNVRFIILWLLYFFMNYFIINSNHPAGTIPGMIVTLISIGSFCIVSKLRYSVFKYLILRIVALLALVSIIHFLLYEAGIISPRYVATSNGFFYLSYLHRHLDGRLSGMYWEPGAYQIILNFSLLLYLKDMAMSSTTRREKYMLYTIILASVLTSSTASYFVLCVIIVSYIIVSYKSNRITAKMFFRLFFLVTTGIMAIIIMFNSSVIQNKFAQEGHENSSYEIRMNDNLALLQMIQEKPVLGWGLSTLEYANRSKQLDNRTASNGPLAFTAYYGIIIAGIFFLRIYSNIGYLKIGLPKLITFAIMIFLISFENFMMFPLMFVLYMRFADEKKQLI